jgi:hypothetical protein
MKFKFYLLLLVLFLMVGLHINAQSASNSIIGTWKLISLKQNGKVIPNGKFVRMKFISKKNFTWVQSSTETRIIRNAAGGTYTYDGKKYTEKITFVGIGVVEYLDKTASFTVTVKDNKLYQSGRLPTGEIISEVWERMD